MMYMYPKEEPMVEESESEPMEASQNACKEASGTITTLNSLSQVATEAQGVTEDEALINARRIAQERVSTLKDAHSYALDK